MVSDVVLQCCGHERLRVQGVPSKEMRVKASIHLQHSTATMTWDAIIQGRDIRENGISGDPFWESVDIGSREPGLEVLPEGMMDTGFVVLGCSLKGLLDPLKGGPTKVRSQTVQVLNELGLHRLGMGQDHSPRISNGTIQGSSPPLTGYSR